MKKSYKIVSLILLILITITLSLSFVSASENITDNHILEDTSFSVISDEVNDGLKNSLSQENSKIDTEIKVSSINTYSKENVNTEVQLKNSDKTPLNNNNINIYSNAKIDNNGKVIIDHTNLKFKDSKNKEKISNKNSKNMKSYSDEDCCSFFLQVSKTESVGGFRRDNTGKTTIYVKKDKLGGIPVVKHCKPGGFVHLIVFANGWIVGNGGLDSYDFIKSMEKLATDMVKSNKIKKSSLLKIYRYKHNINFGHFSIKAPDGRYAVVWKNKIITGKLKPGEFSCSPNFKQYYRHSTFGKYSSNPAKAAIKVGATDHYGTNRRQVVVLHWKATTDKNLKTTSSIKAYASNDNGRYVGVSSGRLVDNVVFNNKFYSSGSLPKCPKMKYLGSYNLGNVDKFVKIPTTINAPIVKNTFNTTKYFKVSVKNKNTNKAISKLKINLKLTQNGKTADYSIITDKKGVAKFNTKDLKIGTYNVVLSPTNNKYTISGESKITIV